jgi:release factor glutamine methyltransferase
MTSDPLYDELRVALESPREARWLLDELDGAPPATRRTRALALARRRAAGEPLQYVLGHWPFRALDLLVDRRALIPRPETELLVDRVLEVLADAADGAVVCDLGCGCGAIALSVALETRARGADTEVLATDASDDALALAERNAERTGARGVAFLAGSWYDALPVAYQGRLDVICANPPYVAAADRAGLARELDFEPEIALVADDGTDGTPGFAAIERVVTGARRWLAPEGTLLVEHGAEQRAAALACAESSGLVAVRDHDDLAGLPRLLEARRPR